MLLNNSFVFYKNNQVNFITKQNKTRQYQKTKIKSMYSINGSKSIPQLSNLNDDYEKLHSFSTFASWTIPDHLMVGRYPYVEPGEQKKCRTHEKGEAQLIKIMETGIKTFISLQNDVSSQNEMKIGGEKGFLPYKQVVELIDSAMKGPPPTEIIEGFRNPTRDKYLPEKRNKQTIESNITSSASIKTKSTIFVHHPILGLDVLKPELLLPVLNDIEQRLIDGEKIYMHCWGGRGRAGLIAACFLSKTYQLSAEESIERVSRSFLTRKDDCKLIYLNLDNVVILAYTSALSDSHIEFIKAFNEYLSHN